LRIEYGIRSDQGRVRASNEDACVASICSRVFLVADGMGGHAAGEIASQIAASTVEEMIAGSTSEPDMESLLQQSARAANTRVYETQKLRPDYRGMGSTLTVLVIRDDHFYVAQVGDSRAYLLRDGVLDQITRDHSLVWPLYESGVISKDDISRHPQKNLITRSIGTHAEVEADLHNGAALAGDVFLLCSDGLTDVLSEQEIQQILSLRGRNPQDLCDALVQAANVGGGPDNVTTVVVRLLPD
jgi:PPM family protein phosphatase